MANSGPKLNKNKPSNADYQKLLNIIKGARPNWPTPIKFIGRGAFGMVYNTNNGRVMKIAHGNASNEFKILREIQGMHFVPRTRNKNLIVFNNNNSKSIKNLIRGKGYYGTGHASAFIMNRAGGANGMTLKSYLNKYPNANMNRLTSRLVNIVKTFGTKGFVHRNLHSENIIVTADSLGRITGIWLIDFGLAQKLPQRQVNEMSSFQLGNILGRQIPAFGPEVFRRRVNIANNLKLLGNSQNLKRLGRSKSVRTSRT